MVISYIFTLYPLNISLVTLEELNPSLIITSGEHSDS